MNIFKKISSRSWLILVLVVGAFILSALTIEKLEKDVKVKHTEDTTLLKNDVLN